MPVLKSFATCILSGKNFNPFHLIKRTNLKLEEPVLKGDMNKRLGTLWEYGAAEIIYMPHINQKGKYIELTTLLDTLIQHQAQIKASGVETIDILLNFYIDTDMASWHIEYENLKKLVSLGVGLSIDYYQMTQEELQGDDE